MKITIDYDNKTIEVHSCENLLQLMNHIGRALPNGEWESYKLLNSVQIVERTTFIGKQNYDLLPTPGYNPPYTVEPWTPIGPTYSTGTTLADLKSQLADYMKSGLRISGNVNDILTNSISNVN